MNQIICHFLDVQSLTENERYSSSLPRTQSHERIVNAHQESAAPLVNLVGVMMEVVVRGTVAIVDLDKKWTTLSFYVMSFSLYAMIGGFEQLGRCSNEGHNVNHSTMFTRLGVGGLDQGQTKGMSESIGNLYGFVLNALATGTSNSRWRIGGTGWLGGPQLGYRAIS